MSNADYKPESAFVKVRSLHYFTNTVAVPPPQKGKHLAPRPSGELVSECHVLVGKVGFVFVLLFTTALHDGSFQSPLPSLPCLLAAYCF